MSSHEVLMTASIPKACGARTTSSEPSSPARGSEPPTLPRYAPNMFLDQPQGFQFPERVAERRAMLATEESAQPLRAWRDAMVARRQPKQSGIYVPDFDPAEGGAGARALLLFEAPGPGTVPSLGGSGFISVDNNDQTAKNVWDVRNDVGLHEGVLSWNIVPWVLEQEKQTPTAADLAQGAMETRRLMQLLPNLAVVAVCGTATQRGWKQHVAPYLEKDGPVVVSTWLPSQLAFNQPGKREGFTEALRRVARLIN